MLTFTWPAQTVSVDTSLLATSANQTTEITKLTSIDGKLPSNLTVTSTRLLVDGSGVTQPVSAASLPLPSGAATETTLSALNTKIPSSLTVSSTRLLVDGSGVTQPISASSLPLPSGAATSAKQPALGTAGSASTDVITVQGIASMTALKVDGSAVTQPVSNAGTFAVQADVTKIAGTSTDVGAGTSGSGTQRSVNASVASATLANVTSSASNVTLLSSSATRLGATFYNDSTASLYLKFGATASSTSFTVLIPPSGYYELPGSHVYSGIIDGIWSAANGSCRVTSW